MLTSANDEVIPLDIEKKTGLGCTGEEWDLHYLKESSKAEDPLKKAQGRRNATQRNRRGMTSRF